MATTIKQVADRAGVSIATVSRFLTGAAPVSGDAGKRIRAAVEELQYVPHEGARSLIRRRSGAVGVLLPDLHGEFFSELIRGIDRAARAHGLHLIVSSSNTDRRDFAASVAATRGRVDGLIVDLPDAPNETLRRSVPDTVPVVLIGAAEGAYDSLVVDNYGGARAMTEHLIEQGRRRIAFVAGPPRNFDSAERLRGHRDALAAAGIRHEPSLVLPGDFGEESGFVAAQKALEMKNRPDAIFAGNDSMAIGALAALQDADVEIPREIAVGGFDDIRLARYIAPSLTTVRVSIDALGQRAMERLCGLLGGTQDRVRRRETLPTELVIRRSTDDADGRTGSGRA